MKKKKYNPEKRTWKGRSYKKGGKRIDDLQDNPIKLSRDPELKAECERLASAAVNGDSEAGLKYLELILKRKL